MRYGKGGGGCSLGTQFVEEEMSVSMPDPLTAGTRRVARPAQLRQAVYDALAEMIAGGSLKPGQHLVESELADHLGVSRQPIREALQRLAVDGWVELRPAYGAYVHIPTTEEVAQLLGVRSVLEAYSAREAAQHATAERMARLRELYDAGLAALATDSESDLVVANADLHAYIVQMSGNRVLAELISQVERRVRWYYTPIARPRGKEAWHEHNGLIEAIAAGDADQAEQVMRAHTERTTEFYRQEFVTAQNAPAG
jgi:DNA-binding GntR family transcriptional regulator